MTTGLRIENNTITSKNSYTYMNFTTNSTSATLSQLLIGTGYLGTNIQVGSSLAINSDESVIASGAPLDNSGVGSIYIFIKSGTGYIQNQILIGTGYSGSPQQGKSVSISSDGNTIAVGGYLDNSSIGATWIFIRSGSGQQYTQFENKLVGTGTAGISSQQGRGVSVSSDGNILAIGGPTDDGNIGATWIFMRSGPGQSYIQSGTKIVGTGYSGTLIIQGYSVELSRDADMLLVGSLYDYTSFTPRGAVWVFLRTGQTYVQSQKLIASASNFNFHFGANLSLSSDKNTLAIGGYAYDTINSLQGAYVFVRTSNQFISKQFLYANNQFSEISTNENNTPVVNINSGGNLIAVGLPLFVYTAPAINNSSAVCIFQKNANNDWNIIGNDINLIDSENQGSSVALTSNNKLVYGARSYKEGASTTGALVVADLQLSNLIDTGLSESTNTGTGALVVYGGIGIGGNLNIGGNISTNNLSISNSTIYNLLSTNSNITTATIPTLISENSNITAATISTLLSTNSNITTATIPTLLSTDSSISSLTTSGLNIQSNTITSTNLQTYMNFTINSTTPTLSQILVGTGYIGTNIQLGSTLSVSSDKSVIVSGAPGDNSFVGSVYVFIKSGTGYLQNQILIGTGNSGITIAQNNFNYISMSSDGNTIALGGPKDNSNLGATWIFIRSGSGQSYFQFGNKLIGSGFSGASQQGTGISLSSDGNILGIVGTFDNNIGATWIFIRSGPGQSYNQLGNKLIGTGYSGVPIVSTIDLSSDGNTLAIGGISDNNRGAVWIFVKTGLNYAQLGNKIVNPSSTGIFFGRSVKLSSDNNILVVGGAGMGIPGSTTYAVGGKIFNNIDGQYIYSQDIYGNGNSTSGIFSGIDILNNNSIAIGIYNAFSNNQGSVCLYQKNSNNFWNQIGTNINLLGSGRQGSSVVLLDDKLIYGANGYIEGSSTTGALVLADLTLSQLVNTNTTESTSTGTGSLVVYGGLGVGGNINAGGNSIISNATVPQLNVGNLTGTPLPSMLVITATGTGTYNLYYSFTINTGTAVVNDTYTNNSITYTVFESVTSSRSVVMTGSGPPTSSGTLTRTSGTGDATLTFTNVWIPRYLDVQVQGGGGGGGGSGQTIGGDGLQGGLSSFGTNSTVLLLAGGGLGGPGRSGTTGGARRGGTGGTVSSTLQSNIILQVQGGGGGNGTAYPISTTVTRGVGGNGGSSYFGGAGIGGISTGFLPVAGIDNTGGGGGGGGSATDTTIFFSAAGGGAGGYIRALIQNPISSYPYNIGARGTAGTASGTFSVAGAAGGSGIIIVTSYYI